MKTRALDAWPFSEWLKAAAPAVDRMDHYLAAAQKGSLRLVMSAINVGEVYYSLLKNSKPALAQAWRDRAPTLPVTIETPTLEDIWDAAALKGRFPISYGDAFAAALAQKYRCPLVTGDPEFRSVSGLTLDWIGKP